MKFIVATDPNGFIIVYSGFIFPLVDHCASRVHYSIADLPKIMEGVFGGIYWFVIIMEWPGFVD